MPFDNPPPDGPSAKAVALFRQCLAIEDSGDHKVFEDRAVEGVNTSRLRRSWRRS
jgi:hypothetical protein